MPTPEAEVLFYLRDGPTAEKGGGIRNLQPGSVDEEELQMNDDVDQTTIKLDDLEVLDSHPSPVPEHTDLHISDTLTLVGARTAGTSTSPGSSDEDN
jgi:hypothetical protein